MYLKQIAIKNIGPISDLAITLPFNENGNPKPLILVGENGTGKTIFQSQIIDSFYEVASELFDDVGVKNGLKKSYYKVSGSVNIKIGEDKGFVALSFIDKEGTKIEYFDKTGNVNTSDIQSVIPNFTLSTDGKNGNQKLITNIGNDTKKEKLEQEWIREVHIFQPAYRYEEPFWKNEIFKEVQRFEDQKRYSGNLYKEIEIISSTKENKSYLLDLVLDINNSPNTNDNIIWNNINIILRAIKRKDNIRFGIGPRGAYRVAIVETNTKENVTAQILLPSIDNLSLGESILLNLFINIIRHGDKPPRLAKEIQGIVAIDEIDVHLHTDLQNTVLPQLIKIFPKIQFIITTHSPLFILGMKKEFGENGFEIRNMPNGEMITTERFSEFENAYNILKNTEKFEKNIKEELKKINKPVLYVEDEYYQIYQVAYLKLNDIECNEDNFEKKFNDEAFFTVKTGKSAGGVAGLLRVKDISIFEDKKFFGLFDFDKEGRENFHHLAKDSFWEKENIGELNDGFYKKRNDCTSMYALLLPIPDRLNYLASLEWENFVSYVEIENLLPENFLKDNDFVDKRTAPGNISYYKCKKDIKNILWKKLFVLKKEDFIDFENIFKFMSMQQEN